MKTVIFNFVFRALVAISAIVLLFFLYVFLPKKIDLVVVNSSGFDVTYVSVLACDTAVKFPMIKKGESKKIKFSPGCEGSYDVLYLNGVGELISSKNLGYITTHLYAEDTISLLNDKAVYIIGRRFL